MLVRGEIRQFDLDAATGRISGREGKTEFKVQSRNTILIKHIKFCFVKGTSVLLDIDKAGFVESIWKIEPILVEEED